MDSSDSPSDGCGEAYPCEGVSSGLVVARGDGAPVLQATEGALDDVALAVGDGIEGRAVGAGGHRRDDDFGSLRGQEAAQVVGVVGLVTEQALRRRDRCQQVTRAADVMGLARRQEQRVEPAVLVSERVDLGRAPAAGAADRLALLPLLPLPRSDAPAPQCCPPSPPRADRRRPPRRRRASATARARSTG